MTTTKYVIVAVVCVVITAVLCGAGLYLGTLK